MVKRTLLLLLLLFSPVCLADTVVVDIIMNDNVSMEIPHTWGRALAQTGSPSVSIRRQRPGDVITIAQTGTQESPIWRVTGSMDASGSIIMPDGQRFAYSDAQGLAGWIKDLPAKMKAKQNAENAPQQGDFGLSKPAMDVLLNDLKQPVGGETTAGMLPLEVIQQCAKGLSSRLALSSSQIKQLNALDPIDEDLSQMAKGTVLAYLLRPAGLSLVPYQDERDKLQYSVVSSAKDVKPWPIGIKVAQRESEVIPDILQAIPVNINNTSVRKVLASISDRVEVPFLYDFNSMARFGINIDTSLVNLPGRKMSYLYLMQKSLSSNKLKAEFRMDENGAPFFWVTTQRTMPN